jgi:hypothetical protein
MRNSQFLAVAVSAGVLVIGVSAAELWNSKDYAQWSEQEVQKVLNSSPWAQRIATGADQSRRTNMDQMGGGGMGRGGGGGGGMGGMGANTSGGGWGMGAGSRAATQGDVSPAERGPRLEVVVRWESALPIKQARLKSQFGENLPHPGDSNYTLDQPDKDYVISVTGMRGGWGGHSQDSGDGKSHLLSSTQLLIKGKDAISPEDVKFTTLGEDHVTEFLFPRTNPIDLDDKEVTFQMAMGNFKIERKFKLKDMVVGGKLSL